MTGRVLKLVKTPAAPALVPPKGLSKSARAEWLRLAPLLKAAGTLTPANEPLLGAYVSAMALIAECDRELSRAKILVKGVNGSVRPHPLISARGKAFATALQLAKRLGIIGNGTAAPPEQGGTSDAWSRMDL